VPFSASAADDTTILMVWQRTLTAPFVWLLRCASLDGNALLLDFLLSVGGVGSAGCDFEEHVAGLVSDDGMGIGMEIVHEHVGFDDG
jgi:hypothetical protein